MSESKHDRREAVMGAGDDDSGRFQASAQDQGFGGRRFVSCSAMTSSSAMLATTPAVTPNTLS